MLALNGDRQQLVVVGETFEGRPPGGSQSGTPGHRADGLRPIQPSQRGQAHGLRFGGPGHRAQIPWRYQRRDRTRRTRRVRARQCDLAQDGSRLVAHARVLLRRLDATERVGVGQSRDSRHPHPWVGVLRRDRRQQILRVVPKVIDRRSAH